VAVFFIDTATGHVATHKQLVAAKVSLADDIPPRPWLRIQGTNDATTMWYAVLRKATKGIFIGALTIRHGDHHASLLEQGWEEVAVSDIRVGAEP
jgi:hypothetical protein